MDYEVKYMPGYMTHYIFGREEYKKIPSEEIREAIRRNRTVYNLGLQGPDIFFYNPMSFMMSFKNPGSIMHTKNVNIYFTDMLNYILRTSDRKDRDILISYLCGFIGHYSLDVRIHPYIYGRTNYDNKNILYHGKHIALETDLDYLMVQKYLKKNISEIQYGNLIKLTKYQSQVISNMLTYVLDNAFYEIKANNFIISRAVKDSSRLVNIFTDKHKIKKRTIKTLSYAIISLKNLETLFIYDDYETIFSDPANENNRVWENHRIKIKENRIKCRDSFFDLLTEADRDFLRRVDLLSKAIESDNANVFRKGIGNKSFLSGIEIKKS